LGNDRDAGEKVMPTPAREESKVAPLEIAEQWKKNIEREDLT